jgi:hypothetical protein
MLPGNTSSTLVGNYIRAQQGVIDTVRISADDLRLTVGEKVQALVTNQINNGRFAVLIKDQLLDLNLPRNTQPGEQFELTVLSKEPQLTFRLSLAANQAPNLANTTPKDANVALSKGAALIGALLTSEDSSDVSALKQSQPLFVGKPDTAQLAGQLAARLIHSGLFYESHQAEWVNGQRPFQSLLAEPQATIGDKVAQMLQQAGQEKPKSDAALLAANSANLQSASESGDARAELAPREAITKLAIEANSLSSSQPVDESGLKQLVRQQLDLVENKPIVWQGQAWPGQALNWELELENERNPEAEDAPNSQQWQTRLQLDLPKLGALDVVAQLQQGQFKLRFSAANQATLQLLREQQPELMRRFEAAGLQLISSQVTDHDQA